MRTLNQTSYRLISRRDVKNCNPDSEVVFRVNLYDDNIAKGPLEIIYIQFQKDYSFTTIEPEKEIRSVLKNQFKHALAFEAKKVDIKSPKQRLQAFR